MRYFEDLPVGETIELGTTTVDEDEMLAFARRHDPQPFHLDPEAAARSMFGGIIASGWFTSSLLMGLLVDGLLRSAASLGSPGCDELRWPTPVRAGDTLRATYTVVDARASGSRPELGIVKARSEVRNQHDQVVMSMTGTGFFGRRPTPGTPSS